jgi:hypothetical protein
MEAAGIPSTNPALSTRSLNTQRASVVSPRSFSDLSLRPSSPVEPIVVSGQPCVPGRPHNDLPNYPGKEFETPDRQILIVFADVPPQDGETDEQRQERENVNAARAIRRQQEVATPAPGAGLQLANAGQVNANAGQVNANDGHVNANAGQQVLVAPAAPQQRCQDDAPRANRLHREISSGTSSATDSKYTTHRKPTWGPLLPLSTTSKIPQ